MVGEGMVCASREGGNPLFFSVQGSTCCTFGLFPTHQRGWSPLTEHTVFFFFLKTEHALRFVTLLPWKKSSAVRSAITFPQHCMFSKRRVQLGGHFNNNQERWLFPKASCKPALPVSTPYSSRMIDFLPSARNLFYVLLYEKDLLLAVYQTARVLRRGGKNHSGRRYLSS